MVYTTGMSDLPMTLPDEIADREELEYAEVFSPAPGDWNLGKEFQLGSDVPPESFWPIQLLKFLARFPHEYQTWLGWGAHHPQRAGYEPLRPGVGFLAAWCWTSWAEAVPVKDGQVNLLFAIPAYREEIEYKLKYGMEALRRIFPGGTAGCAGCGAMAQGLFCSLLIGTILNTIGTQFHIGFLTAQVITINGVGYTIGGAGLVHERPAMAVAIGYALQAPPMVLFSLVTVGYACNALGGARADRWPCCSWPSSPLRWARP